MNTKCILFVIALFLELNSSATPRPEEGKIIFTSRCAGCHNVNKILTGPALAGIDERRSIDWIINFVHSSQSVIKRGDKDAVALFEKFNKIPMPDHPDLTADNIKSIVKYIKSATVSSPSETASFRKPGKLHPGYVPLSIHNYEFFLSFFALVAILIGTLLFAVHVKTLEREMQKN